MRLFYVLCTVLTGALLVIVPDGARALEKLDFNAAINSPSISLKLNEFFKSNYNSDSSVFDIAQTDLNHDGVDEYIAKRKSCALAQTICSHFILADKRDGIFLLSSIRTKHLMVGGTKSFGISDLLAFSNEINDYNFDIYMWSPAQKMYILKRDKREFE